MQIIKVLMASLTLIILLLIFNIGCVDHREVNINQKIKTPITITDDLDRVVILEEKPSRIVSLAPSNTEIIYALGLENKLIGVTQFCNYPIEALEKEIVGGFSDVDIEKVISLNPDLILAEDIHKHEVIPALEGHGLKVIAIVPHNLQEVMESIILIGKVTGNEDKAIQIVDEMKNRVRAITDKTNKLKDQERPKVLYVIWHEPMMSVGNDTRIHELIEKAGGVNVAAAAGEGYPTLTLEEIISVNPQVIIVNEEEYEGGDISLMFVLNETRLAIVDASKNGRIYGINADLTNRPTQRMVLALELIANMIHPEIFSSIE
ncbi:MAG: cobalamin-binding protein [Dehalococcoidia bacterium]|nr:MAG: cobalamin-binding protein [Dehalococcoidia bacterium]